MDDFRIGAKLIFGGRSLITHIQWVEPESKTAAVDLDRIAWSVRETAAILAISERTFWSMVRSGDVVLRKVGPKTRRVTRQDLIDHLDRHLGRSLPAHEIRLLNRLNLSLTEVGEVLGLGSVVVANLAQNNALPVVRVQRGKRGLGRGVAKLDEVLAWLGNLPTVGEADFRNPVRKRFAPFQKVEVAAKDEATAADTASISQQPPREAQK